MSDNGQVCCAGSRTYVQAGIYDEFVKRSAERAARRTVGSPFDPTNENGPQVWTAQTAEWAVPLLLDNPTSRLP